ncbi:hypothetical protein LCGC14_2918060, partial [marine sediment metagenome]
GPAANAAPVFQVVLAAMTEAAWEDSAAGLSARDIAMNVALPEVDGRILSRAISFKDEAFFDEATECAIATYRARGDRIEFVARLAAAWVKLRTTPADKRRVALVLANYPNKDGRLANGVGLDSPAATIHAMRLLDEAGVVVTPGTGYGPSGEGYVRLSLTLPDERLEEGVRRLVALRV